MIFKAAKGSILSDEQAERYGKCISELAETLGGRIKVRDILEHARAKASPFHDFFEWDDTLAAEKWRIRQARYISRSVNVEVVVNGQVEKTRLLWHINEASPEEDGPPERVYVTIGRILIEDDLRAQVVATALKQLVGWKVRYKQYQEFTAVVEAIDDLSQE